MLHGTLQIVEDVEQIGRELRNGEHLLLFDLAEVKPYLPTETLVHLDFIGLAGLQPCFQFLENGFVFFPDGVKILESFLQGLGFLGLCEQMLNLLCKPVLVDLGDDSPVESSLYEPASTRAYFRATSLLRTSAWNSLSSTS